MQKARAAGTLMIATLAIAAAAPSTAPASKYEKTCGVYGTSGKVKAHNTSCREAEKVIRKFWVKSQSEGSPITINGFACKGRFHSGKYEVSCNKDGGRHLVRWRGSIDRKAPGSTREAQRESRDCGTINVPDETRDAKVLAHNVRCRQARRVAKYFIGEASKPKGWICSASIGRCYKNGFDSNQYIRLRWS